MTKEFVVAVIGGGICGLALTSYLSRQGINVHLFEAAPSFQEIGAGVGLGPNAIEALRGLGLLDEVVARSDDKALRPRAFEFYKADTREKHEFIYAYPMSEKTLGLGIHRASFLDALVAHLPAGKSSFNKRCLAVADPESPNAMYTIKFVDGTEYAADIVIGCDGIKSTVRGSFPTSSKPTYMNTVAYRGLIPTNKLKGFDKDDFHCPRMYVGVDKHIICFLIRGGSLLNVVAFCCDRSKPYGEIEQPIGLTWVTEADRNEFAEDFHDWCPHVDSIITTIQNPTKWTLYALQPPLESYCHRRIALVGDAAHGMLPHLGAGAGQGLEDAYLLGRLLVHPSTNKGNLAAILQAYSKARVPRANRVLESSTIAGEIWEGRGARGPDIAARRADIEGVWDWVWHGNDLEEEFTSAVEWLKAEFHF